MRIIFDGSLDHARQLLGDFESRFGLNQPFNEFLSTLTANLPEVTSAAFSGDVVLPEEIWASRDEGRLDVQATFVQPSTSGDWTTAKSVWPLNGSKSERQTSCFKS